MKKLGTKHFLTGEELTRNEIHELVLSAIALKTDRKKGELKPYLKDKTLAAIFEKPSLRTRVSFTVAMNELGGNVVETLSTTSKKEEPEDVARVLAGYCHGIMYRTFDHATLDRMVSKSPIPVINGLSDTHHPCQVLADLMALKEHFGELEKLTLTYIGDGNNMLHSILLLMPFMGVNVRYACPKGYEPNSFIVKKAKARAKEGGGSIQAFTDALEAAKGANAIYTDVWTSMGFENQSDERETAFENYQVNETVVAQAAKNAVLMHCMPMVRGKEISESLCESPNALWFQQSENRMHVQKALMIGLMSEAKSGSAI